MAQHLSSGEKGRESDPRKDSGLDLAKGKERWNAIRHALGSRMKALEVLAVLEGAKKAARTLCNEEKTRETRSFLESLGLIVETSDFKLILEPSVSSSFTEKSQTAPLQDSRNGHVVLYVSLKNTDAEQSKHCEMTQNHTLLGELLGYPSCCCAFFEKHFSSSHTDLTIDTLEGSSGFEFPFLLNIAARHVDASLLSHFPCSFSCERSLELAKKLLAVAKNHGQEDVFYLCLQTAVVYSEKEGVIFLQHPVKNGNIVSYSTTTSTAQGKLSYLLSDHNRITILGKHSFVAGDDKVESKDSGVMLFS
jgi:hypothetical protein